MKKLLSLSFLSAVLTASFFSSPALAMTDHEADCSIWLCLPSGFPSGCSAGHKKFIDRIKKFRSPLPNFASCMVTPSPDSGVIADTPKPPYELLTNYGVYINNGSGVKKTLGRYSFTSSCPYNGEIITYKRYTSGSRDITEKWLSAICTRTKEYGTTFNDYIYIYSEAGKPLEVTNGKFTPRMLSRSSSSNR